MATTACVADDRIAIQYAKDAVNAFQTDFDRLKAASSSGAVSEAQLERCEDELFDARLLLLRLEMDDDGATKLMRADLQHREEQQQRLRKLADRGYVNSDQLGQFQLRVLSARLRLAKQTKDQELKTATLKAVVEAEEQKLKSLIDAAPRGEVRRNAIAVQKLRIARIIAEEQIPTP